MTLLLRKSATPLMARFVYELEAEFGPTERLYVCENGHTDGTPSNDAGYVQPVIVKQK